MRATARPARQRGLALMMLLAIVVLVMSYLLVSRFNAASAYIAVDRESNGKVLNQAKQALIGWVARQAATANEDDPGRLPCPEAPGNFGGPSEGIAAGSCTLPAVGRLPWRTLGLDKLVDAANEPLWYVVSTGWALPNSTTHTLINSNSMGQLTVDGIANHAVALIIAPGRPFNSATACSAVAQVRPAAGPLNRINYLECDNSGGAVFATTGAGDAFNDQVIRITAADVLPEIEAAIAERIEREIVPLLKTVYSDGSLWNTTVSTANPAYPFPTQFADPAAATSYEGNSASCSVVSNACQGLLPVKFNNVPGSTSLCTPANGPLCDPTFVRWTAAGSSIRVLNFDIDIPLVGTVLANTTILGLIGWNPTPGACSVNLTNSPHTLDCQMMVPGALGQVTSNVNYEITGVVSNVAMALRRFEPTASLLPGVNKTSNPSIKMNPSGSATITVQGQLANANAALNLNEALCGLSIFGLIPVTLGCHPQTISVPMTLLPDHNLLNTADTTTGWFIRNEWYRVLYYAVARTATSLNLPTAPACTPGTNCLTLNAPAAQDNKRSLLLLAGRSRNGTVGSTRALSDFLDSTENQNADAVFEKLPVGSASNDRVVVVDTNP